MEKSVEVLIGVAILALMAPIAFALFRWRQRKRVKRVKGWVRDYLAIHHGQGLKNLLINCSNDPLWPVLVSFEQPRTGIRHRLQFTGTRQQSTLSVLSATEDDVNPHLREPVNAGVGPDVTTAERVAKDEVDHGANDPRA